MENEFNNNVVDLEPVGNDKLFAILSYVGILWILGLVIAPEKDHAYVKNHVNTCIWLTIFGVVCSIIPFLGWLASIAVFVFWLLGLIAACQGKTYTMPLFGDKLPAIVK